MVTHAAEMIQGREDALFVHDKGPGEILVAAANYALVDRLTEATARFPYTVANVVGLFALFLLGWRLFGPVAGWVAAMLLAVDGYFVGFARIVQYQSIVFLMVVLVVLILYRLVRTPRSTTRYLSLAAILFATGLLAHYEAALAPVPWLLFLLIRKTDNRLRLARSLVLPMALGTLIVAGFYVPFALHPRFARTFNEIANNRIGGRFPYNNLEDFFSRTLIYSSSYYLLLMVALTALALLVLYRRNLPRWGAWAAGLVTVAGLALTFWSPTWLTVADTDYMWLFFAVPIVAACLLPRTSTAERIAWIWLALPLMLAFFFVQKPRTHVYDFFMPWALLNGMIVGRGRHVLARRLPRRPAYALGTGVAAVCVLLFGNYTYWLFTYTDVEVLRTWDEHHPAGYWTPYPEPVQNSIFGFPFKNGWKVVGVLSADGELDGPFARNGKRGVANWYTRGVGDCSRDQEYYIYTPENEPTNKGLLEDDPRPTVDEGYQLFASVTVHGETRLEIFKRGEVDAPPPVYDVDDFAARFDNELSGPRFEMNGPVAHPAIQHPLNLRFGPAIRLKGYTLPRETIQPGASVDLTLYWQATADIQPSYKVFTQIINLDTQHKAGQRDGVPGCEKYPTSSWLPGDINVDRYTIPIFDDAPAGDLYVADRPVRRRDGGPARCLCRGWHADGGCHPLDDDPGGRAMTRRIVIGAVWTVAGLLALGLLGMTLANRAHNEQMYVAAGYLLSQGQRLYADFAFVQMPYMPWVYAAVYAVTGAGYYLLKAKLVTWVCLALAAWLLVARSRRASRDGDTLLAATLLTLFLANYYTIKAVEEASNYALPLLLSVAAYVVFLRGVEGRMRLGLAAVLAGLALGGAVGTKLYYATLALPFGLVSAGLSARGIVDATAGAGRGRIGAGRCDRAGAGRGLCAGRLGSLCV